MSDLIQITTSVIGTNEVNSVDARELHSTLEIKKDFSNWIKRQIESLGLDENIDYILLAQKGEQKVKGSGGHNAKDYIITTDAAKHISMASRTAKGKEVRAYFIEVEKQALEEKKIEQKSEERHETKISSIAVLLTQQHALMGELLKTQQQNIEHQNRQTDIILELMQELKVDKVISTTNTQLKDIHSPPQLSTPIASQTFEDEEDRQSTSRWNFGEDYENLVYEKYLASQKDIDEALKLDMMKIKKTEASKIAKVLGCCISQVNKYKTGFTGLSNYKALLLQESLGLSIEAFNEIRKEWLEIRGKEEKRR